MDRCCGTCRHFFSLLTDPDSGTCHKRPPRAVSPEHFLGLLPGETMHISFVQMPPDERSDRAELQRWPGVHCTELCAAFAWRCLAGDCREPARILNFGDEENDQLYCIRHSDRRRPRAA